MSEYAYAFDKVVRPVQLHDEFDLAHPLAVATIRSNATPSDGMASRGVVVHNGALTDAAIQAVIDAHVPQETNEKNVAKPAVAQIISDLANHVGTANERLNRVELALAWLLRDRRSQQAGDLT